MGRAEDLFSRIEQEGMSFVESLIVDRASEELFLEFKRSSDNGGGTHLHERDRINLRKAVSGFANSEGGVIVWGVECAKDWAHGDVASAIISINNPNRFVSWLEGAISGCTVPPVSGVRSVAIVADSGTGVVATFVPKSSHAPHQLAGEGKYVIRAGSDFVPAPHGVVAGLFGRPPHPILYPNFIVSPATLNSGRVYASATIVLVNDGQVVAEDLFLSLLFPSIPDVGDTVSVEKNIDWPTASSLGIDRSIMSPREFRLAPGGLVSVMTIHLRISRYIDRDFRCKLMAGCKGAIPYSQELFVSRGDLKALVATANAGGVDMHAMTEKIIGLSAV